MRQARQSFNLGSNIRFSGLLGYRDHISGGKTMVKKTRNIVLIGMPGCGKSTVGVILAKMMALNFVDTDVLIQTSQNCSLQEIVDTRGISVFRQIEEKVILELACTGHVIATGGSVIYSRPAMMHLKSNSIIVFLDVNLETLESRVVNFATRGIAKKPDQSLSDLFSERCHLYETWADIKIPCSRLTQEQVCEDIIGKIASLK